MREQLLTPPCSTGPSPHARARTKGLLLGRVRTWRRGSSVDDGRRQALLTTFVCLTRAGTPSVARTQPDTCPSRKHPARITEFVTLRGCPRPSAEPPAGGGLCGGSVSRCAKDRGSALGIAPDAVFRDSARWAAASHVAELDDQFIVCGASRPIPRSSEVARSTHAGGWREAAAVVQDGAIGSWPRAAGQRAQTRRELDPCGGSHLPRSARRASAKADALRAKTPKVSLRSGWTRKAL